MNVELTLQAATLATLVPLAFALVRLSVQFGRHVERIEQLQARVSALEGWKDDVDKDLRRKALGPGMHFPLAPGS